MTGRVGLIVNPRSHTVATRGSQLDAVHAQLPQTRLLRLTEFAELRDGIAAMARDGVDRIFVEGGDGTLHGVLTAALAPGAGFARLPDFMVLPGGSTNLASKVIGYRGGSVAAICARIRSENREESDRVVHRALRVESASFAEPAIGFLLSTGSLPRAMLYAQRQFHGSGRRGSLALALAISRFVLAPHSYLDSDGAPVLRPSALRVSGLSQGPDLHAFSVLTSLPHLSLRLNPFWGSGDGAVALTHVAWPIRAFRRSLLRILAGRTGPDLSARGFTSHRHDQFVLLAADQVMMDGELLPTRQDAPITVSTTQPIGFLR